MVTSLEYVTTINDDRYADFIDVDDAMLHKKKQNTNLYLCKSYKYVKSAWKIWIRKNREKTKVTNEFP